MQLLKAGHWHSSNKTLNEKPEISTRLLTMTHYGSWICRSCQVDHHSRSRQAAEQVASQQGPRGQGRGGWPAGCDLGTAAWAAPSASKQQTARAAGQSTDLRVRSSQQGGAGGRGQMCWRRTAPTFHFVVMDNNMEKPAGAGLPELANGGEDAARVFGRGQWAVFGVRAVDFSVLGAPSVGWACLG